MVDGIAVESLVTSDSNKIGELDYIIKKLQGWKCKRCDRSIANAGHIYYKDTNSNNHSLSNLISLCAECYQEAKQLEVDNLSYLGLLLR